MEKLKRLQQMHNRTITAVRTYYQQIISAALLVLLVLIVYWDDLGILANEAVQSENFSHVLLMPFFAAFLFYLKRDLVKGVLALERSRKRKEYLDELVGVILCLVALLLYWYGSYTFHPLEYHLFSLVVFIMGVTVILSSTKVLMALILPILFFLFLIPPPSEFLYIVGGVMANFNTQASYLILKSVGLPVTLISSYGPPVISFVTSTQEPLSFAVDLSCSGIYSLIAFAMFATFLALIIQSSILKKIGLFVAGFLVFEILNVLRLTIIVLAGYWFGEEVALLVFHTATGFLLIFVGMLLILLIAEKVWRIEVVPTSAKPLSCPACRKAAKKVEDFCLSCGKVFSSYQTKLSKRFWTKLFLLLVGVSIAALSIQAPTFAIAREAIEVTSGWETGANILPPTINITDLQDESYTLSFLYRDEAYERQTNQEASLTYAYFPENKSQVSVYVTVGVAKSVSNLHSWEVCLITWQTAWGQYPLVSVLDSSDVELLGDVPLIARYLVFERPEDYIQMTLYWYERAAFKTGLTVEQRYVRISLIILLRESAEYKGLKDQLISFGQYIASYWRPFENQALVSLGVPTLQLLLIVSSAFLVLTKLGSGLNEQRRKTGNLKIFRTSAPPQERLMLQSILDLAKKKGEMETREILDAVKENVKESTNFEELQRMLKRLEEYGFVTRDVVSVENKPKQVWKTKVHEL